MNATETVRRVALAIHSAQSLDELFARVQATLLAAAGCGTCTVLFGTPDAGTLAVHNSVLPELPVGTLVPAAQDPAGTALREGRAFHATGAVPTAQWAGADVPLAAAYPLAYQDERYGVLVLHEAVAPEARDDAAFIAEQTAVALIRLQLYEEARHDLSVNAAKLAAITQAGDLLRQLDLEVLLIKVMELSLSVVSAQVGSLMLQGEGAALATRVEWGLTDEVIDGVVMADGARMVDRVVAADEPLLALDLASDERFAPECRTGRITSLLCIPLGSQGRALGCLNIVNTEGGAFTEKDMQILTTIAGLASTAIENATLHKSELERAGLQEQLRLAGEIQRSLLPSEPPRVPGAVIEGFTQPCDDSGGDYYDYFPLGGSRLGFCIGDVSGHGIGAAMLMATARAFLRAYIGVIEDLAELFGRLNNLLVRDMGGQKFITLLYGVYDWKERKILYTSAGHDPPVLYRSRKDTLEELDSTGMPLGLVEGMDFPTAEVTDLEPGDVLLAMTDGVWEAMDPKEEKYSRERLSELVRKKHHLPPQNLIRAIYSSVKEFCGEAPQRDDITMVCLQIKEDLGG